MAYGIFGLQAKKTAIWHNLAQLPAWNPFLMLARSGRTLVSPGPPKGIILHMVIQHVPYSC
jgi:hypothetical protein